MGGIKMTKKQKKEKYEQLKGSDLKNIINNVDNKWEMMTAIWLCKNKEAKGILIKFQWLVIIVFLFAPDVPAFIKQWVLGFLK